jgi:hypothetical protein
MPSKAKVILSSFIVGVFLFLSPSPTFSAADSPLCPGDTGIQTAIGCIPVLGGQQAFLEFILTWAIGVGGGIAFLLIVYAGFLIMTSQGNPERLKAGQELLTAAISGVVLLVLSVFILNIIGVKILEIPGFGGNTKGGVPKIMP